MTTTRIHWKVHVALLGLATAALVAWYLDERSSSGAGFDRSISTLIFWVGSVLLVVYAVATTLWLRAIVRTPGAVVLVHLLTLIAALGATFVGGALDRAAAKREADEEAAADPQLAHLSQCLRVRALTVGASAPSVRVSLENVGCPLLRVGEARVRVLVGRDLALVAASDEAVELAPGATAAIDLERWSQAPGHEADAEWTVERARRTHNPIPDIRNRPFAERRDDRARRNPLRATERRLRVLSVVEETASSTGSSRTSGCPPCLSRWRGSQPRSDVRALDHRWQIHIAEQGTSGAGGPVRHGIPAPLGPSRSRDAASFENQDYGPSERVDALDSGAQGEGSSRPSSMPPRQPLPRSWTAPSLGS